MTFVSLLQSDSEIALDPVTGLPDRRELARRRQLWDLQSPQKRVPHAVLFLDLDYFKQVNDRYGHAAGDQVLAELSARWQRALRDKDAVVRYGGDEFVVLLNGVGNMAEAEPVVKRLQAATAEPVQVAGVLVSVNATIGIAVAQDTSSPLEELLNAADRAMYAAKPSS